MSISVAEAHITLLITNTASLVGIAVGVKNLRKLRDKLNGHLKAHHAAHASTDETDPE